MSKGSSCQPICSLPLHRRRGFEHFAAECVNRSSAGSASGSQQKQNAAGAATAFGRDFLLKHTISLTRAARTQARKRVCLKRRLLATSERQAGESHGMFLESGLLKHDTRLFPHASPQAAGCTTGSAQPNPEGPLPTSPKDPIALLARTSTYFKHLASGTARPSHTSQQPAALRNLPLATSPPGCAQAQRLLFVVMDRTHKSVRGAQAAAADALAPNDFFLQLPKLRPQRRL